MLAQLTELKVQDVAIKLHRAGRGPSVLFLHGAGGVPQWLPFFDVLAERYELLVPEHPGFGGSDDPPWIHSMPDLAMFYLDLVEEAGLDRIHLIGNSLGGWLAAEILIRDRSRFRSLVQLAPAGIRVKGVPCLVGRGVPGKDTIVPHPVWQNCYWRSSGQLSRTTVEDECWRSQSDSDHRLDGRSAAIEHDFRFRLRANGRMYDQRRIRNPLRNP
jgi:pimeloyl-ACP methyl ester carboxylesterase